MNCTPCETEGEKNTQKQILTSPVIKRKSSEKENEEVIQYTDLKS